MATVIATNLSKPASSDEAYFASRVYFKCDTAAATATKVATSVITDLSVTSVSLVEGLTIYVQFDYSNTAADPQLQIGQLTKPILVSHISHNGLYIVRAPGVTASTSWYPGAVLTLTYNLALDGWVINNFKTDAFYETVLVLPNDIDPHVDPSGNYVQLSDIELSDFSASQPDMFISRIVINNAVNTTNNVYSSQYNFVRSANEYRIIYTGLATAQYFDTQHQAAALISYNSPFVTLYIYGLPGGTYDPATMFFSEGTYVTFYFD